MKNFFENSDFARIIDHYGTYLSRLWLDLRGYYIEFFWVKRTPRPQQNSPIREVGDSDLRLFGDALIVKSSKDPASTSNNPELVDSSHKLRRSYCMDAITLAERKSPEYLYQKYLLRG